MVEKGAATFQRLPGREVHRYRFQQVRHHHLSRHPPGPVPRRAGHRLGKLNADGVVVADEVLAKHDEKYMPPEVTKALKDSGQTAPTPAKEG
jgi:hypothetical protein